MTNLNSPDLEPLYLYILSLLPIRQLTVFDKLLKQYGSFEAVVLNPPFEFAERLRKIKSENSVEKIFLDLEKTGVKVLPYYNSDYPKLLKEIHDAPPVLFYRGALKDPNEDCIAIVGSRKMSSYGATIMPIFAKPLIDADVTIVSGLAYGADSAAHIESVKQGARTIAVLGSGVDDDSIYPRAHLKLAHDILDNNGLIISEHPPGMPGLKQNFIARNRIIAGLSLGVVIVECKTKSGALLTADFAADFNRNLYAVPGPVYSSLSEGPHLLIKNGAMLTSNGDEILDDLAIAKPDIKLKQKRLTEDSFTENERRVLKCMQDSPATTDAIIKATNLATHQVTQIITTLELKGVIKNLGSTGFIKL